MAAFIVPSSGAGCMSFQQTQVASISKFQKRIVSSSTRPINSCILSMKSKNEECDSTLDFNSKFVQNVKSVSAALALSLALSLTASDAAFADVPSTTPSSAFFDDAGVVQKGSAQLAEKALASLKQNTGIDVHFVVTRYFPYGEDPFEYAKELYDTWGLGEKDLVIVGGTKIARAGLYGGSEVNKLLSSDVMRSIGDETFPFKARGEKYSGAVLDVNNRLLPILYGKEDPGPPVIERESAESTFKSKEETSKSRFKYW
eukprot:CAMPEP_0182446256 /NCGR_PEP_ID=MMETSP1172-20130603/4094_1 /TAXON_ID=708627 /ORGANISM="Timspurckia oligopyrenoides, Strain CCMP3278" /LENGTH=257 /DNA_ID=CAMNT_0024642161 /DNA_START=67 /DNA_END=837 /DNA_ORIENTATION=-